MDGGNGRGERKENVRGQMKSETQRWQWQRRQRFGVTPKNSQILNSQRRSIPGVVFPNIINQWYIFVLFWMKLKQRCGNWNNDDECTKHADARAWNHRAHFILNCIFIGNDGVVGCGFARRRGWRRGDGMKWRRCDGGRPLLHTANDTHKKQENKNELKEM